MSEFGLRWKQFNSRDQPITKQKIFSSKEAREKFLNKLVQKSTFYEVVAYFDEE